MSMIRSRPVRGIEAHIRVPGDKSMSHRALLLAGLAEGTSVVGGLLESEDCLCTLRAMQALGAGITRQGDGSWRVEGVSGACGQVIETIDCGNSGTSMRLLAGVLAAQPFPSRLSGDASLNLRPMRRIIEPLTRMGAGIESEGRNGTAPLRIYGGALKPIAYESPVASAQVKSCVLLAAMHAEGVTSVTEPMPSRDHTERMMRWYYLPVRSEGLTVSLHGRVAPQARDFTVPGDFSSAAFWVGAAAAFPGARLHVEGVGLNPTRTAFLGALLRMGAQIHEYVESGSEGEVWGHLEVQGRTLHGTTVEGWEIPNLIDEVPILAVVAALADGETVIRNASELRVKETDRIMAVTTNLRAFGIPVEEREDGMVIQGGAAPTGAVVDSFGDHRIAMAFAVLGMFAKGETRILNTDCIATSYPGFEELLARLLANQR